jgi:hypothetical protein
MDICLGVLFGFCVLYVSSKRGVGAIRLVYMLGGWVVERG